MSLDIPVRIVLLKPPPGIDFGVQKGSGNSYETILTQRSGAGDLRFEFSISVEESKNGQANFKGPFVQGPVGERFIYIDIGTYAGHIHSTWSRRLKIPLRDIPFDTIKALVADPNLVLETQVPGTAKDGGPNCATVKPFAGWRLV